MKRPQKEHRLSLDDRRSIIQKAAKGEPHAKLSKLYGVTENAIYKIVKTENQRLLDQGTASKPVSFRLALDEFELLEAKKSELGYEKWSPFLRHLSLCSLGIASFEPSINESIREAKIELNRSGVNLNQISRRLNEAAKKGNEVALSKADRKVVESLSASLILLLDKIEDLTDARVQTEEAYEKLLGEVEQ